MAAAPTTSPAATPDAPSPHRWLVLLAMTGSLAMIFLDVTVVGVALPSVQSDLGLGPSELRWAMNAYTLAIASLVALGGRLADSIGRVRCFVSGVAIFALASVLCGVAKDASLFLLARALQGLGAALMQPSSSTIVINSFAPGERGKAMGVYVGIPMAFLALGPVIGGLLTEYVSWRACFLVNIPVAAAAIGLTAYAKPSDGPRLKQGMDPFGAILYLLGLPALVFGLQEVSALTWRSPVIQASVLGGLFFVLVFFLREWRRERPRLAVRLFGERGFLGDGIVLFCMQFAMTGQVIFMSAYFQVGLGFPPARAGAALMPMLLPVLVVVHVAGRMYDRRGARAPVLLGTALASIGLAIEAAAVPGGSYPLVAVGMAIFGLGIGFVMSPTSTDALSRVGPERRGQASGLMGTVRQVAASAGIAVVGSAVLFTQLHGVRDAGREADQRFVDAAQGEAKAMAALATDSPEEAEKARHIMMAGTAAGQWPTKISSPPS